MSIENQIRKILETYQIAVSEKNLADFMSIYDSDVAIFDMWGPAWICGDSSSWRNMAEEWFSGLGDEQVKVEMENIRIKHTREMAFTSAFVKYTAISRSGEALRSLQNRMTCVMENKSGTWKIVHEHTSAPIDSGNLKALLSR